MDVTSPYICYPIQTEKSPQKKTFINTRPWWWKPFQLNEEDRYLSQSKAVPEAEEWILSKIKYLLLITRRKRRAEQYTIHFQIIILTLNTKKKKSLNAHISTKPTRRQGHAKTSCTVNMKRQRIMWIRPTKSVFFKIWLCIQVALANFNKPNLQNPLKYTGENQPAFTSERLMSLPTFMKILRGHARVKLIYLESAMCTDVSTLLQHGISLLT